MVGWTRTLVVSVALMAVSMLYERQAHACSCFPTTDLFAPTGSTHPVGAPLLVTFACAGNYVDWQPTIDGTRVRLEDVATFGNVQIFAITPPPAEGAEVVLTTEVDGGPVEVTRFTVGPADTQAPEPVGDVVLAAKEGSFDGLCSDNDFDLSLRATVEVATREPGTWAMVTFRADGEELTTLSRAIPEEGNIDVGHLVYADDVEGREVCAIAEVHDASDNISELVSDCEQRPDGCACTVDGAGTPPILLLAGLAWLRRRQCRRVPAR